MNLERFYQAEFALKKVARKTGTIKAQSIWPEKEIYLKTENLQRTGSFKLRGAYFKMSTLTNEEKARGVVACSAGNHAQGVALAAKESGVKATIFLPSVAPISKVEATRSYGAEIRLIDGVYDDAFLAACKFQEETNAVFIHPFDDEDVICGQGTIGLEILEQIPDVENIVVPVGGGGLIAGIGYVVKKLNPKCKVYGVQAKGAGSMYASLLEDSRERLLSVSTFADGIAVKEPGELTYELCKEYVDEVVTVTDDEIAAAILTLMEKEKLVSEGAGAVAVAALMFDKIKVDKDVTCALVSGGNIDVNILSRVVNRGLQMSGRVTEISVELLDKPGQLLAVAELIAKEGANVTKVSHKVGGEEAKVTECVLHITLETRDHDHLERIKKKFIEEGYKLV